MRRSSGDVLIRSGASVIIGVAVLPGSTFALGAVPVGLGVAYCVTLAVPNGHSSAMHVEALLRRCLR
jgi:hypothetical protein